jgi:hypothetical protein
MRLQSHYVAFGTFLAFALCACGAAVGGEPSESQMKEPMLYAMNHPPGEAAGDPITITFFKKEACDNPTPKGYNCSFDVKVASKNIGASIYNDIPGAWFYQDKDSGKWAMRPPF